MFLLCIVEFQDDTDAKAILDLEALKHCQICLVWVVEYISPTFEALSNMPSLGRGVHKSNRTIKTSIA
jgi:hypothetical protein